MNIKNKDGRWRNWAHTEECRPQRIAYPTTEEELRTVLAHATRRQQTVRPAGSGHSFNDLVATDDVQVSLDRQDKILAFDRETGLVRVQAGIKISALIRQLARVGLALENLGDIEYQSLAGAISTGTHGTGAGFGPLSSQVRALTLMVADGSIVTCSRDDNPELFAAARTSLGALGVIVDVTLQAVPAFRLAQRATTTTLDELEPVLPELLARNRHFDFLYEFHSGSVTYRETNVAPVANRSRGRVRARFDDVVVENGLFGSVTALNRNNLGRFGSWASKLPPSTRADFTDDSARVFTTPRLWRLVATELSIDVADVVPAVRELGRRAAAAGVISGFPLLVRFVAPDDSLLGTAYGRPSAYVCPVALWPLPYDPYFQLAFDVLDQYAARPHWGKRHFYTHEQLAPLYPRWSEFQQIRAELDPHGLFQNAHLRRVLGDIGTTVPAGSGRPATAAPVS